jgi:hypothetical protein
MSWYYWACIVHDGERGLTQNRYYPGPYFSCKIRIRPATDEEIEQIQKGMIPSRL